MGSVLSLNAAFRVEFFLVNRMNRNVRFTIFSYCIDFITFFNSTTAFSVERFTAKLFRGKKVAQYNFIKQTLWDIYCV